MKYYVDFPLWALSPTIRAAVEEAALRTQAPNALIASSALAAASLSVQTQFNVRRHNGLVSPCSLYCITVAESGERKTTVDRFFFEPFTQFEKSMAFAAGFSFTETEDEEGEE